MTAEIKRLIAPVIAMLRHDVAQPSSPVLDKAFALEQLEQVLDIMNDTPVSVVESSVDTPDETRVLRNMIQESFDRKD